VLKHNIKEFYSKPAPDKESADINGLLAYNDESQRFANAIRTLNSESRKLFSKDLKLIDSEDRKVQD